MKKLSLLMVLVLALGLPGCRCCQKKEAAEPVKKNTVQKYMETDADIEELDLGDLGMEEEEEETTPDTEELKLDLESLEDIDIDDLLREMEEAEALTGDLEDIRTDLEDIEALEGEEALEDIEEENAQEAFHWIDEQSDDELRKLYFAFNHYGIRPDQKDSLVYDIEQVKQLVSDAGSSQPTIVIEGHACQEGDRAYNIALSEKRAKNVADIFVAAGVNRRLIKVVGRGQECPVVMNGRVVNGSRTDRAPNRRVEVRVIYT